MDGSALTSSCPDPPVVARRITEASAAEPSSLLTTIKLWNESAERRMSATEAYGVPRVFDLFTLMAITLAFAVLFALLKLLSPAFDASSTGLTLLISGYVTLIALAQMFMYSGSNPRMASIMAGPVAMLAMFVVFWIPFVGLGLGLALSISVFLSILFGFAAGYLAGAVVAGVLLIADGMRGRTQSSPQASKFVEKDIAFDDIE